MILRSRAPGTTSERRLVSGNHARPEASSNKQARLSAARLAYPTDRGAHAARDVLTRLIATDCRPPLSDRRTDGSAERARLTPRLASSATPYQDHRLPPEKVGKLARLARTCRYMQMGAKHGVLSAPADRQIWNRAPTEANGMR